MFFKKKNLKEKSDEWKVLQGNLGEKPVFTRLKQNQEQMIGHPNYPFQIGIAVPLIEPTEHGLTTESEGEELWKIEDELTNILQQDNASLHLMTITYNGMREFVFYAINKPEDYFREKIKKVESKISSQHQLQFMMQPDEEWETYKEYSA
jgi:hypothetical protein